MNKKDQTIKVFACGVDYQHEIGECRTWVFPDVETLKEQASCWKSCGIVELEVKFVKWVEPQDLWSDGK